MNGHPITQDDIATTLRMRRAGYLCIEIARHLGRTIDGVKAILKGRQEKPSPAVYRMRRRIHIPHELRA